jgi:hypothetical protein
MDARPDPDVEKIVIPVYTAYLEDLGRIGGRHETIRAFYLSVVTAVFAFLALAGQEGPLQRMAGLVQILVAIVGIAISAAWFLHMWSFAQLYRAKFETLHKLEKKLGIEPFTMEQNALEEGRSYRPFTAEHRAPSKRVRVTIIDRYIAVIFGVLFLVLLACNNWL